MSEITEGPGGVQIESFPLTPRAALAVGDWAAMPATVPGDEKYRGTWRVEKVNPTTYKLTAGPDCAYAEGTPLKAPKFMVEKADAPAAKPAGGPGSIGQPYREALYVIKPGTLVTVPASRHNPDPAAVWVVIEDKSAGQRTGRCNIAPLGGYPETAGTRWLRAPRPHVTPLADGIVPLPVITAGKITGWTIQG